MTTQFTNAQRSERLYIFTSNFQDSYKVVGTLDDKDALILDQFLSEFINSDFKVVSDHRIPFYINTGFSYSLCTYHQEEYNGRRVAVLTLVIGTSPMNWGGETFIEVSKKVDLENLPIYMRLFTDQDDTTLYPIRSALK